PVPARVLLEVLGAVRHEDDRHAVLPGDSDRLASDRAGVGVYEECAHARKGTPFTDMRARARYRDATLRITGRTGMRGNRESSPYRTSADRGALRLGVFASGA